MRTLLIDTSTEILLVILAEEQATPEGVKPVILSLRYTKTGLNHAQRILEDLEALLEETETAPEQLTGIGCSLGPGSFTGLRIGLCTAKGLAEGWKIPLFGLDSLRAMAEVAALVQPTANYFLPVIDARKGRFYGQIFQKNTEGQLLPTSSPLDLLPSEYLRWQKENLVLCGYQPQLLQERLVEQQKWPTNWAIWRDSPEGQGVSWAKTLVHQLSSQESLSPWSGPKYLRPSEAEEAKT